MDGRFTLMTVWSKVRTMDIEIQVAVQFIVSFINGKFSKNKEDIFENQLHKLLIVKFHGHWYPEKPTKGSAYRCISIENNLDTVISKAARHADIDVQALSSLLPKRLDLWIDPAEVSYRIGSPVVQRSVHQCPSHVCADCMGQDCELGAVVVIYKEGDDLINSTSQYLATVLSHLPTVVTDHTTSSLLPKLSSRYSSPLSSSSSSASSSPSSSLHSSSHVHPRKNFSSLAAATENAFHRRVYENHMSPGAKSFSIARSSNSVSNMSSSSLANQTSSSSSSTNQITPLIPLLNLEQIQKLQWGSLLGNGCYDPLAAQLIQNYLIMQELQKFETRRIALQSHYLKMQNIRWPRKGSSYSSSSSHSKQHGGSGNSNGTGSGAGSSNSANGLRISA